MLGASGSHLSSVRPWGARLALAAALVLGGLSPAGAVIVQPYPGSPQPVHPLPVPVGGGVSVAFSQLDWLGEFGQVAIPDSRVAVAELSFTNQAATLLVTSGAYVNITTEIAGLKQWSVQNLFLHYPSTAALLAAKPTVQFGMPTTNGTPVNGLKFVLTVTKRLRGDGASLVPNKAASVVGERYHVGGIDGGGSGLSSIPYTLGPWIGQKVVGHLAGGGSVAARAATSWTSLAAGGGPQAVNEGTNGCAPGSVARAIGEMTGEDAQDAYEELYDDMGTNSEIGTYVEDIVSGKNQYCDDHGFDIDTQYGGWPDDGDLGNVSGTMDNGGTAEAIIDWSGGGGHAAMVTSVTPQEGGGYEITYVDDPHQGDDTAENEEHCISTDAAGNFDGGSVRGFITEDPGFV